jgi:hypothetical protein
MSPRRTPADRRFRNTPGFLFTICYGSHMSGVTFMVDSKGRKTAAVIDLRKHRKLWEDFYDTALAHSRAREPRERLASVKRRLRLLKADA